MCRAAATSPQAYYLACLGGEHYTITTKKTTDVEMPVVYSRDLSREYHAGSEHKKADGKLASADSRSHLNTILNTVFLYLSIVR